MSAPLEPTPKLLRSFTRTAEKQSLVHRPSTVDGLMEMIGSQLELNIFGEPIVDHQRAEQRRFRLAIVRKNRRSGRRRGFDETHGFGHGVPSDDPRRDTSSLRQSFGGRRCGQLRTPFHLAIALHALIL